VTPTALPREAQVDEVKDLVAKGKEAGFLTSDDIGTALVAAELPPESTDAVLRLLADALSVPRETLAIVSGHSGRDKIVELSGLGPALIERRLMSASATDRGRKDRRA
jgi:hypothetical protein